MIDHRRQSTTIARRTAKCLSAAVGALALGLIGATPTLAQENYDLSVTHPETYTKIYEDAGVWVWESFFPPGTKGRRHSHLKPYSVYIVEGGSFRITAEDGSVRNFDLEARKFFESKPWRNHWAWNTDSEKPARFIVIQPK